MKTLFILIACLFIVIIAKAQNIVTTGTNNAVIWNKGGYVIDTLLRIPIRGRSAVYPNVPYLGRLQLNKSDSIPEWYNGKKWMKINDYNDLKHTPVIPTNTNQLVNGANFISGINSAMIALALGFTPYSSANPAGYISTEVDPTVPSAVKAITGSDISNWNSKQANLGFTPYNATNPAGYISTEFDPTVPSAVKAITGSDISNWNSKQANLGFTPYNATNPAGYISTEVDPTVPSAVKAITGSDISNWNGKQANLGFTPYNATNPAGYISTEVDPTVPSAVKAITGSDISNWNGKSGPITINAGTGISVSGGPTNWTISTTTPTVNSNPGRVLNTNFTASTSRTVLGIYTIVCNVTNPLVLGTSSVTATYQYSTNGGSTWNSIAETGASSGVGVTVTIQLQQGQRGTLVVPMPANTLSRINVSTSGTASATLLYQAELPF